MFLVLLPKIMSNSLDKTSNSRLVTLIFIAVKTLNKVSGSGKFRYELRCLVAAYSDSYPKIKWTRLNHFSVQIPIIVGVMVALHIAL